MSASARTADAYARCRRLHRRRDPTFYVGTRLLPADVRPAVHALYGYVRGADDLVDGHGPTSPDEQRAALDAWEAELHDGLARGHSDHPVVGALVDAGARHDLPLAELHVYMDSMRVDLAPTVRLRSRDELDRYMRGSAEAVGRVMAPLLGARDPGGADALAAMGTAFQLTNFIRDVDEDFSLGRVYLPDLVEDDLAARRASPAFRAALAAETALARDRFEASGAVLAELEPAVRPGMRLARAVYLRILDRVEQLRFDVLRRSPRLAPWQMTGAALAGLSGRVA